MCGTLRPFCARAGSSARRPASRPICTPNTRTALSVGALAGVERCRGLASRGAGRRRDRQCGIRHQCRRRRSRGRADRWAALNHATHETDSYRERGAGALGLVVAGHRDTALRSELGARLAITLDTPGVNAAGLYAYAAWAHEFTGENAATARLAGDVTGIALPLRAIDPAGDAARFGAGFHFLGGERLRIVFGFDGEVDARQMFLNASVGLRYAW